MDVSIKSNLFVMLFILGIFSFSCQKEPKKPSPPNILLIVADDLGYADLGSFGGDIATPNLDELAKSGIRFSRFHTAPLCAVSRAMLLSGNDNHIAGMGSQDLMTSVIGYEGKLSDRIIPVPELLQSAGYHTYIAGKWHLGLTPDANPAQKGFEKSYVTLEGAANHFSSRLLYPDNPQFNYGSKSLYTENGIEADWPEGAYSSNFYTDKLISYIDSNLEDGKPFFAFAAYTSPHWPLQVEEKYWKKYEGKYNDGYEKLRERRLESLKKVGMIPSTADLPKLHPSVKSWDSLSDEEKAKESRKMEIYSGMVDNLDVNIGRLISYLKNKGIYENTLIVFLADNGAAAEDFYFNQDYGPYIQQHYTEDYEEMGTEKSFVSYGPKWAEAGTAPFRYFKSFTTEGGMNTPMIISGLGIKNPGTVNHSFVTILDLAPSFYQLAGTKYPTTWKGKKVQPLIGNSIEPLISGKANIIHDSTYVFGLEHRGRAMILKGNWKLVNLEKPIVPENFNLYNISNDLGEQHDLKDSLPEKFQEMLTEWERYSKEVGVVFPTPQNEQNK